MTGEYGERVTVRAKGKWKSILTQLGVNPAILDGKHHPCPTSGEGDDRFRFSNRNGKGNFFCACNQGKGDGFQLLKCMYGWDFKDAAVQVEGVIGEASEDAEDRRKSAEYALRDLRAIQRAVRTASSDEGVRAYLAARGIDVAAVYRPGVLHDATLNYGLRKIGITDPMQAMVAKFVTPKGKPSTFHITYLDGAKKADIERQRVVATPVEDMVGGAVRLMPAHEELGVSEGIETAYSASTLFGFPVWATLNAYMLEKFEPPPGVKRLVVFGDNDHSFTGQAAAFALAKRAKLQLGLEVEVRLPPRLGMDWNDVLTGGAP